MISMSNKLCLNIPLKFVPSTQASQISLFNRISTAILGSPNWRRANGIVSSKFEIESVLRHAFNIVRKSFRLRQCARQFKKIPIYEIDRIGTLGSERLPRIWLSELVVNTSYDIKRRVFVECYPCGYDAKGKKALELAKRYLGEGNNLSSCLTSSERIDCYQASEILLMHSVMRGNREASMLLLDLYKRDLCEGIYWDTYINQYAKHARSRYDKRLGMRKDMP